MIPFSLYAIGGLGLATVLVGGWGYIEHQAKQNAELRLGAEQEANRKNQETITTLTKATEIGSQVAIELSNQLAALTAKQEQEDEAITQLANSDSDIKKFLATPVPDRLRCLWEHQKCENGAASTHAP